MLYEYLKKEYGENTPILISDIQIPDMSETNLRQQIKKLTDSGLLKRYDTGIYFIPGKSIFKSGSQLSLNQVIEKKYLQEQQQRCGYLSGITFANQLGLTTQVPMVCEVVTNKATKDYRETRLANSRVIIRRPRIPVTEQNYRCLQFLDLMKDIDTVSEVSGDALQRRLLAYMERFALRFSDLEPYLPYYPDKIYKNLYEARLIHGLSTQ